MSTVFDLSPRDLAEKESVARQYGINYGTDAADTWEGLPTGIAAGVVRGAVAIDRAAALAGSLAPMAYDAMFNDDNEASDWYFSNVVDRFSETKKILTTDAHSVGTAGNILGGLAEGLVQLGAGGIPALIASTQLNAGMDAIDQGASANVAQGVGAITGITNAVGGWLPIFGKTLGAKVAGSMLANPAINIASRGATAALLNDTGNTEMAQQYDAWDGQSILVDTLMGAAFGYLGRNQHAPTLHDAVVGDGARGILAKPTLDAPAPTPAWPEGIKELKPSEIDAIMVAGQQKHLAVDSMPGRPLDKATADAHQRTMDDAVRQFEQTGKVSILDVGETNYLPHDPAVLEARHAEAQAIIDEFVPRQGALFDDTAQAEQIVPFNPEQHAAEQSTRQAQPETTTSPEIAQLEAVMQERGDVAVAGESTSDPLTGATALETMPLSHVIETMKAEHAEATSMGQALKEAANCFLRG